MAVYADNIPEAYVKAMEGRDISILSVENVWLKRNL